MLHYVLGDATRPEGDGPRILVHVCNDVGGWGAGFVLAISKRWKAPETDYRRWYHGRESNDFALGSVQLVQVEPTLYVANLIGQHGLRRAGGKPPIRYEAIRSGISLVRVRAIDLAATVHMPRIGCGLAGGTWDKVEPILIDELDTHAVQTTVYDFG